MTLYINLTRIEQEHIHSVGQVDVFKNIAVHI